MKFFPALILALLPTFAHAEATGGYGGSYEGDIGGAILVGVLILVAIIGIIRMTRKGRK
ncbi:hypothetical protein [Profundibacter sp.]|uniref:hypothetical protein n=1 Tax=Profundibacter sp. TaxID=3101071 RepID=UPI003D108D7C